MKTVWIVIVNEPDTFEKTQIGIW